MVGSLGCSKSTCLCILACRKLETYGETLLDDICSTEYKSKERDIVIVF
ncbi:MAG: hypothetical protein HUJ51_00110 [Eggerthellaceae bacterium]|nr:hypothetical protein [Eggerthellaceae bacterium]